MAGCRHAVDAVLHVHRIVLRFDVNVARPPLDRAVDGRVHQADHGLASGGQLLDRQRLVAGVVFTQNLQLKALGRILEHALRAFALLQDRLDGRGSADGDLDWRRQQDPQLVDHRQVGGVGDDDHEGVPFPVVRHEAVPEHQVGRNRPKQLVVDAELRQIDEVEPIALGKPLRLRDLRRVLSVGGFDAGHVEVGVGGCRRCIH